MKQTAVDWFFEVLFEYNYLNNDAKHLLKVAKEMEKEQMLEVSKAGCFGTFEFEDYYNENYKSE